MMAAAAMGATAFQKGLGGMHALAHPIGALYDSHHGMTNATLMPYVLAFNRSAIEERVTRLAAYRSEEHTSELQSLMRISYAVFCLKKKRPTPYKTMIQHHKHRHHHMT